MNLQIILVTVILVGAIAYAGAVLWKKARSFSPKSGCDADCGCGGTKDKTPKPI